MSQAAGFGSGGGGGGGITTIAGDSGSITGTNVTIFADNASINSGSSVAFVNSGTVSTLNVTDLSQNTLIGNLAGNLTLSGNGNTGLGFNIFGALSSGAFNSSLGVGSLGSITTGSNNNAFGSGSLGFSTTGSSNNAFGVGALTTLGNAGGTGSFNSAFGNLALTNLGSSGGAPSYNSAFGSGSGTAYTGAESSNTLLSNAGVLGESNVMRLGTTGTGNGQVSKCFVAGISGVTTAQSAVTTINPATDQMATVLAGSSGNVLTSDGTNWTSAPASGGGISEFFTAYLSADTGNVTGDGTYYPIICDTFLGASNANYNTTTGNYTAPATGTYMVTKTVSGTGTFAANTSFNTYWNGSVTLFKSYDIPPSTATTGNIVISASIVIPMTAGDTIGIAIDVDGSGAKNVLVDGGVPAAFVSTTMFSVTRLA